MEIIKEEKKHNFLLAVMLAVELLINKVNPIIQKLYWWVFRQSPLAVIWLNLNPSISLSMAFAILSKGESRAS